MNTDATLYVRCRTDCRHVAEYADTPPQETAGELLDDTVITAKVKVAFVQDETVSALPIAPHACLQVQILPGFLLVIQ